MNEAQREQLLVRLEIVENRLITAGPPYDSDFMGREVAALVEAVRLLKQVVTMMLEDLG